jgi:hypothetical protein
VAGKWGYRTLARHDGPGRVQVSGNTVYLPRLPCYGFAEGGCRARGLENERRRRLLQVVFESNSTRDLDS